MSKISIESKSFIILFLIALFGTVFCLNLSLNLLGPVASYTATYRQASAIARQAPVAQAAPPVDPTGWKTYTNTKYGFSFLYNPDWKVLPSTMQAGYEVFQVDPGKKYYNIKIYISTLGYYVMGGLPLQNDTIGGQPAMEINGLLYGVKDGNYYYTFDVGLSTSLKPNFDALVYSVKFNN